MRNSQDNIDNESEFRQKATGDLSPQCNQSEPVMDRELEEMGTDERKKKRGRPKGRKMRGKLEKIRSWKSFGGERN